MPTVDTPPQNQSLQFRIEKRKRGKTGHGYFWLPVLLIANPIRCKSVQAQCGAGGSVDGQQIEIQGDHLKRMGPIAQGMGYKTNPRKRDGLNQHLSFDSLH